MLDNTYTLLTLALPLAVAVALPLAFGLAKLLRGRVRREHSVPPARRAPAVAERRRPVTYARRSDRDLRDRDVA